MLLRDPHEGARRRLEPISLAAPMEVRCTHAAALTLACGRTCAHRPAHTERIWHSCTGGAGRWSSVGLMTSLVGAAAVDVGGVVSCNGMQ